MERKLETRELAALIKSKRGKAGLRATAKEIGISAATLSRVEQEKLPDFQTFNRICDWLGVPASRFLEKEKGEDSNNLGINIPKDMDTPGIIATYLRADRTLSKETAEALTEMIRLAYQVASKKPNEN